MRTTTPVRAGVLLAASALGLGLAQGPAGATVTATDHAAVATAAAPTVEREGASAFTTPKADGTTRRAAAGPVAGDVTLSTFEMRSGLIARNGRNSMSGTVTFALAEGVTLDDSTGFPARGRVTVDGDDRGYVPLYYTGDSIDGSGGVDLQSSWGPGRVTVSDVQVYARKDDTSGPIDVPGTSSFYARRATYAIHEDNALDINRKNKDITFAVTGVRIFQPTQGRYATLGRIELQYKNSAGHWRHKKTIRLDKDGKGTYKTSTSTKRRYRIYQPTTSTIQRLYTKTSDKI